MDRIKDFDGTGVAPNGRLFPGDLNSLQDLVAALYDLTQTVGLSVLAIGQDELQLVRYGALEGRITGSFRIDGILRGLGGIIGGAFTTTARNAIVSPPYGLIILNTTTNQYEWNSGTAPSPVWSAIAPALADGSITAAKLASDAVTTIKILDANVTLAKLATSVPIIPVGAVFDWPWGSGTIPSWSALPYGQSLLRASFPALNTLAADNSDGGAAYSYYGSADGTHFTMPDYRGRVQAGRDNMGGAAANRITAAISGTAGTVLGAAVGAEGVALVTGNLPAHNHPVSGDPAGTFASATHHHDTTIPTMSVPDSGGVTFPTGQDGTFSSGGPSATASPTRGGLATDNTGGGTSHLNVQPTLVVNKIMRMA